MQKIQTIEPFIQLNLHTVPLIGKSIHRNQQGKKEGFSFEQGWQQEYQANLNTTPTKIGGLLTSEQTVVAIDADDPLTYQLFRSLDKENTAYFDSIGKLDKDLKPIEAGTILYKSNPDIPPSFRSIENHALDFFNGSGMVFLPTEANTTKTSWLEYNNELYNHNGDLVVLKEMPRKVLALLNLMKAKPTQQADRPTTNNRKGFLAKILQNYDLTQGKYIPQLTQILTPKGFRLALYKKQKHLHPNDIPSGLGHDYLFKIASAVASDNTVDKPLFIDLMNYLNNLWDEPMPQTTLDKTIIKPIVTGQTTNQRGEPYWQYDENWESLSGFSVITKRDNELVDVFYDSIKRSYYVYHTTQERLDLFYKRTELLSHLKDTSGKFDQKEADDMEDIHTFSRPTQDYGYTEDNRDFNMFKMSEALKIMQDPIKHEDNYTRPTEFISYMEHFIPNKEVRSYFLRLLRTKLTTFKYSPVVPYIIGVEGSGKNTIMEILKNIMGDTKYVKSDIGGEQFLEKYNGWVMDVFFIQLNELGDTISSFSDKKKAEGILKNYTGSGNFECRAMRTDPFTYPQTAMFLMTANHSPLHLSGDSKSRRLYYINTPNMFDDAPQCKATSPVAIYTKLMEQTNDIAYYLATEYKNLSDTAYVRSPNSPDKMACIVGSLGKAEQLIYSLSQGDYETIDLEWNINSPLVNKGRNNGVLNSIVVAQCIEASYTKEVKLSEVINRVEKAVREYYPKGSGDNTHSLGKGGGSMKGLNFRPKGLDNYIASKQEDEAEDIQLRT